MAEKPQPPGEYDCCESGCDPCVWDTYYEDLKEWQTAEKARKEQESLSGEGSQPKE